MPGIIIIAVIIIVAVLVIFLGKQKPNSYTVPITPSQIMPSISGAEARSTICKLKKEGLFSEACQEKFNIVGKDDGEKLVELFTLLKKVQGDKSLSDYDRLLLGQLVFAALPNKDSPQTSQSRSSLLGVAYAQETNNSSIMSEEEFKDLMSRDLQAVVDIMPKGNNAWTIIVMVSKHSWVDGKRQPIYSKRWAKSYDPFPNNPNVNEQDIAYQVSSVVGSRATNQKIYEDTFKGTSEMVTYSFTMMSWKSQEYTDGDGPTLDDFHLSELNFSEEGYQGEDYLTRLIMSVKTPQPKLPAESSDTKESRDTESKESPSPKPSAPTTVGASDGSSGDACKDPAAYCRAIEECANLKTEVDGKILSYEEGYQKCSQSYQEGWYEAAGWLSCPWWKEQEAKNACYESKCTPLSKEIEERRGDNAYLEWDKVVACMDECDVQAKQAAASLQLPKCEPAGR